MARTTKNLSSLGKHFSDETAARELLERLRWPDGPACPRCGGDAPYKLNPKASGKNPARQGLYKCRACKRQFSSTTGTIFESSHIPVSKWLLAIHLLAASKKGMSAHQLHRLLGVTYRAAWFMVHRLRHAMNQDGTLTKLTGTVEVDETYMGGSRRRRVSGFSLVGPSSRCESLLGGSECRLFDLNPFSYDSFDPFVDPTLTMESGQKRSPSGQLGGN